VLQAQYVYLDETGALCVKASCVGALNAEAPKLALTTRLTSAAKTTLGLVNELVTKGVISPLALHDTETTIVDNGV
jgi:hypothetical protein